MLWKIFFSCLVHHKITKKNKIKSFIETQSEAQNQISQQPNVKFSNFNQKPKHKFVNNLAQQNYVQKLFKKYHIFRRLLWQSSSHLDLQWVFLQDECSYDKINAEMWWVFKSVMMGLLLCHYGAPPTHIWDDFQRQWRWVDPMPTTANPQQPPLCAIKRE